MKNPRGARIILSAIVAIAVVLTLAGNSIAQIPYWDGNLQNNRMPRIEFQKIVDGRRVPVSLTGQSSDLGTNMVLFKGRIFSVFLAKNNTQDVLIHSSHDGRHWTGNSVVGQRAASTPQMAVFNDRLYMTFVAANNTGDILVISSEDGINWTQNVQVGQRTGFTPAIAAFKGKLVIVFVAKNDSGSLLACSSGDGRNWTSNVQIGQTTKFAPGLTTVGDKLVVGFIAKNPSNDVLLCTSLDGSNWSANVQTGQKFNSSVNLVALNQKIYVLGDVESIDAPGAVVFNGEIYTSQARGSRATPVGEIMGKIWAVVGDIADATPYIIMII